MAEEKDHKSFWLTLPGILTGAASLLTAVVALMTFIASREKPSAQPAPPPALFSAPTPASVQLDDISSCQEITGVWNWFTGGKTTISADGGLFWKYEENPAVPTVMGRWTCANSNPRTYMLSWQNGLTDTVTLSPDKKTLGGTNQANVRISASRQA